MFARYVRLLLVVIATCSVYGQVTASPQAQKPTPLPYKSVDVTLRTADGATLAGTLTIPQQAGTHPGIVLLPGSGPNDRDETMGKHKPLLVLADHLTRAGFVLLRMDSREAGGSTGKYFESTGDTMARDALAQIEFLRRRVEVGSERIGLLGHSLGGVVAAIAASQSRSVDFLILLSSPGRPGVENSAERITKLLRDKQASPAEIDHNIALLRKVTSNPDEPDLAADLRSLTQIMAGDVVPANAMDQLVNEQVRSMRSPWGRFFGSYDPRAALRKVHCPTLALSGSLDRVLPPQENLAEIWSALREAENADASVIELFGVNHLLQTAMIGEPSEIDQIEETIAPRALSIIAEWLRVHAQTHTDF